MPDFDTDARPRQFPSTRWAAALGPGADGKPPIELEQLVRSYWGPVYWVIRRGWNQEKEEAKDLTQEFFGRLLERGGLEGWQPERGRFRSFLCGAVKHFMLQHQRDRARLKRGGGAVPISLDQLADAEREPAGDPAPPDQAFHQEWVRTLLEQAIAALREEYRLAGREISVRVFEAYDLHPEERPTHQALAARFGIGVHEVNHHLRQARQRLRELLRALMRETLADPADLEDEMRLLFGGR